MASGALLAFAPGGALLAFAPGGAPPISCQRDAGAVAKKNVRIEGGPMDEQYQRDMMERLERYLRVGYGDLVMYLLFATFLIAVFLAAFVQILGGRTGSSAVSLIVIVVAIMGGVFAFCAWGEYSKLRRTKACLEACRQNGVLPLLINTYLHGQHVFDDSLFLDDNCLIGRRGVVPRTYAEIKRIYLYEHRTNFITDMRELRIDVAGGGKGERLCVIPVKKPSEEELLYVVSVVKTKNPSVIIGYR